MQNNEYHVVKKKTTFFLRKTSKDERGALKIRAVRVLGVFIWPRGATSGAGTNNAPSPAPPRPVYLTVTRVPLPRFPISLRASPLFPPSTQKGAPAPRGRERRPLRGVTFSAERVFRSITYANDQIVAKDGGGCKVFGVRIFCKRVSEKGLSKSVGRYRKNS